MRIRTGFTALALCLFLLFSFGAKSVQAAGIDDTALEDYIANEYLNAGVLGMSVEVVSPERELYCASFGAANDPESDYVLGALSQSFTACAILCLEQEGELSLSDTVSDYLSDYPAAADVTIEELLCHTGGIAADERLSDLQARGKRGTYCRANAGYNLLGQMIEQITGLGYDEYLSDNILDPLEMYSTYSLQTGKNLSDDLLPGYRSFFGFPVEDNGTLDPDDDWMQVASGHLISDAKDMGRYLQMFLNGGEGVLSSSRINRMFDRGDTVLVEGESLLSKTFAGNVSYGMGWLQKEFNGQTVAYNIGATETYTAMMFLLPEQELGIALLFNTQDVLVGQELMQDLAAGVLAIAMGQTPGTLRENDYLIRHGIIDAVFFVLLFASFMPIILIGNWTKRRRRKLFSVWSVIEWVVFQAALPTALGWMFFTQVPLDLMQRYVPDVCVVWLLLIAVLYLGALLRIILWIVAGILGPKKEKKPPVGSDDPALQVRNLCGAQVPTGNRRKNPEKFTDTGILHTAQPQEEEPFVSVISEPARSAGSEENAQSAFSDSTEPVQSTGTTAGEATGEATGETLGKTSDNTAGQLNRKRPDEAADKTLGESAGTRAGKPAGSAVFAEAAGKPAGSFVQAAPPAKEPAADSAGTLGETPENAGSAVFAEIVPPAQATPGEVVPPVTFRPKKPPVSEPVSTPKETFSAQRAETLQTPQAPQEIRAKEAKNPEPEPVQGTGSSEPLRSTGFSKELSQSENSSEPVPGTGFSAAKAKYTDIASLGSSGRQTDIEQAIIKAKH